MALLASDLNNPEFSGAHNPDARLAVRFYSRAVQNEHESKKQGHPIFFNMDYVRIQVPGDSTLTLDVPAREEHKQRFPLHWARYQNSKEDTQEIGTPLSQWPRLTTAQAEELRAKKFRTVEAIAGASDQQLQSIGMVAGMSPYAFREAAQRFLKLAESDAVTQQAEERAKEAESRAKALEDQLQKLAAKVEELSQPKKRGRKPKVENPA